MTSITQTCRVSGQEFTITDEDQEFLKKLDMPLPTLSPVERQRRRMGFRNHFNLYKRKCDKTGEEIISLYRPDSPFTIYNQELFWSDKWNAMDFGQKYDFDKPFFEQFQALRKFVPRLAINGIANINSDYTSYAGWSKNCYLTFTADRNEDCFFGAYSFDNKDCADFGFLFDCELCYEATDCKNCYQCHYSLNLENCNDCVFCRDMIGCQSCFGSIGLRNKKYCFFNEQLSQEAYNARLAEMRLDSYQKREEARKQVADFFLKFPRKSLDIKGSENCAGDHIRFSKNCYGAYDINGCEDCRYISHLVNAKDCMDWDFYGDRAEMCYEMDSCAGDINFCAFTSNSWGNVSNTRYCELLTASKYCFGCISLKNSSYCILNKQYTKEEYEELVPRIIEHMKSTGEWGEFFPLEMSPYAYNETLAHEYLPLTKEEVAGRGLEWFEHDEFEGESASGVEVADAIADIPDSICDEVLVCEISGKKYKIIPQELKFYKQWGIPLPRRHWYQRHQDRMSQRNPREWWERDCAKCSSKIPSSYDLERPEIVYCEECYMKEVY